MINPTHIINKRETAPRGPGRGIVRNQQIITIAQALITISAVTDARTLGLNIEHMTALDRSA